MNILFFLILPIATIIFAVALQKILDNPILVAAVAFAVYLILAFTVFDTTFVLYTIIYSILAFIAALIASVICPLFNCLVGLCPNMENQCMCGGTDETIVKDETEMTPYVTNRRCYRKR